ncbi:MAG: sigma-70 family RNA polymerase sigma factor [Phaeodactylibacter sp.]|nr:sigma-70 family RNA polymerase sigma factor [Phaeodactylibacter sp.]
MTFSENSTSGQGASQSAREATREKQAFFDQLRRADMAAIRQLAVKVLPEVRHAVKKAGLPKEDVEEILNDAILVTIKAIRTGRFQFRDYHPAAYAKGVVRKLVANRMRSKKRPLALSEGMDGHSDFTPEDYLADKERRSIVRALLARLGENCRKVLQLKYFEYLKDEEVVSGNLAPYSTVASLKSKRGQCLKKLADLAQEAGITEAF